MLLRRKGWPELQILTDRIMKKLILSGSGQHKITSLRLMALVILLAFMISGTTAQITTADKSIFLSGQVTEATTGAPIPDHNIYILSDSLANNGFSYYAVAKTDANGFYWDTIVTAQFDGILNLSVYDFDSNLISLDRYYRFVWENEYQMFVDFSFIDPNSNTDFQANFKSAKDTLNQIPLKVLFRDQSIGQSVKSWEWNFGDGAISDVQDPEHVYAQPGNYLVTLTITSLPPEFEPPESSTITKQVQVGLTEYYNMGGHVFADLFPIDYGLAYLYTYDSLENLVPLDTAVIDTLGYYYFYQVPEGRYLTKARLQGNSNLYGQFIPTYFQNAFMWNEAETINLEKDNFECDIWLLPALGITSGNGKIMGQVSYDTLRSYSPLVPAGEVEVLLMNEKGNLLTCGLSDLEGFFQFASIEYGTYQLYPDVAGIPTETMSVTITEAKPLVNNISLIISPTQVTFSVPEHPSSFIENAMQIFPNPVRDRASVSIEMKKSSNLEIMVIDPSGRAVYSESKRLEKGRNIVNIDASKYAAGCYQVILIPEDHVNITGKLLKFN
jgi:hypothetical protein